MKLVATNRITGEVFTFCSNLTELIYSDEFTYFKWKSADGRMKDIQKNQFTDFRIEE